MKHVVIIPRFLYSSNITCHGTFRLWLVWKFGTSRDNYEFLTNSFVSFAIINSSFVGITKVLTFAFSPVISASIPLIC